MPTPDDAMLSPPAEHESFAGRTFCPPDDVRSPGAHDVTVEHSLHAGDDATAMLDAPTQQPTPPPAEHDARAHSPSTSPSKSPEVQLEDPIRDIPTPTTATEDGAEEQQRNHHASSLAANAQTPVSQPTYIMSPFPSHRFLPNTSSSLLRPGSRFKGSQTSDRQKYEVEVEIKHVDMRESFLCGYLQIKGLTDDHPSLTTYFESEIIGSKYTFMTQHPEWGSSEKTDRQHWGRFQAYKKYSSRPDLVTKDWMQKEHLFMRWKEYFLVPDHRVRTINGASFEGFYYICFNQVTGGIEGIYFHSKSERFQKLQLAHVEDRGCQGAVEFC